MGGWKPTAKKCCSFGCAGHAISLLGRKVLYYGRGGETHTEYFPGTLPAARP
jgi:hypothetical protein